MSLNSASIAAVSPAAASTVPAVLGDALRTASAALSGSGSLTFNRPQPEAERGTEPPRPALVRHVAELLGRGPDRAEALVQTLVAHGTAEVLSHALRAAPEVVSSPLLACLADHGLRSAFEAAIELRPSAADGTLMARLHANDVRPVFPAMVLRARPDLAEPAAHAASWRA